MDPLQCAIETATEAGRLLRRRTGELSIGEKSARGDLVTAADRESEAFIVKRLLQHFPAASILGEEGSSRVGASGERWIVDPLDGTTNYAHGYPLYCVSIGYERDGAMYAGAVYAPVLDELYAGQHGGGATCNGKPIAVSHNPTVGQSLVCTGFIPARYERNGANFARLSKRAQAVRRDGSAALDLCFVGCGRFDAFWELDLAPWDVAAGSLIVREAGGRVSAMDGTSFGVEDGSILASNGLIHHEMIGALGSEDS
ncbi:MAG: inositol monophosphatase [Candidatus Eremiobacteraeota bacterium]|nr:inositol monophosphatase [Candidatus Eremiobacteraeota bacterium]